MNIWFWVLMAINIINTAFLLTQVLEDEDRALKRRTARDMRLAEKKARGK